MGEIFDDIEYAEIDNIQAYLDNGGDPNLKGIFDGFPETLLTAACSIDRAHGAGTSGPIIIDKLMRAGALVNLPNRVGDTGLICAARSNNTSSAIFCIANGADIDIQNNIGNTALIIAVLNRHLNMIKLLINNNANPMILDDQGLRASDLGGFSDFGGDELRIAEQNWLMINPIQIANASLVNSLATRIQSRFRGKNTRKKDYIGRYKRGKAKSYNPWIGTEALDFYMIEEVDINNYLREDDLNFVIKYSGIEKYEAWNLEDYLTQIKITGQNDINVFYECVSTNQMLVQPESNVVRDTEYIKIGGYNTIIVKPDWIKLGSTSVPEPRIFEMVKYKEIVSMVSRDIHEYEGNVNGGDHCNHLAPVWTYKFELINEEHLANEYLGDIKEFMDSTPSVQSDSGDSSYSSIKEIVIGSIVNFTLKGENRRGEVMALTKREDKFKICCKPGKNKGDKGSVYLIPIGNATLVQDGGKKKKSKKKMKKMKKK